MANPMLRSLRRVSLLLNCPPTFRPVLRTPEPVFTLLRPSCQLHQNPQNSGQVIWLWQRRSFSHGSVRLVISPQGKPKFETHEIEPPKKEKWKTKKRLKLQRKREKQKRKAANKRDPRRLGVKGKKKRQRFSSAEERIKYKLKIARIKESALIERLKRYEVPKAQGPVVEPHVLTGEERFYMKKMAQKGPIMFQLAEEEFLEELFLTCIYIGRNMKLSRSFANLASLAKYKNMHTKLLGSVVEFQSK
ncbi:hypothetical protein Sango_2668000 [Sesamum angolense]|uniref:Uncharacterized protein n=1 Tax=Sesamum angolense TaxID=2727404 RepID=A0AAE1W278_9LAMI|nr:hypothetical protein Sango_2668000 [Sesamum angolense]